MTLPCGHVFCGSLNSRDTTGRGAERDLSADTTRGSGSKGDKSGGKGGKEKEKERVKSCVASLSRGRRQVGR